MFIRRIIRMVLIGLVCMTLSSNPAHAIDKKPLPVDPRPLPTNGASWNALLQMPDLPADLPVQIPAVTALAETPWHKLRSGDIVLGRGPSKKNWIPHGYFRHAGIWDNDRKKLISAMPAKGVVLQSTADWDHEFTSIAFLRVRNVSAENKGRAVRYASSQLGKPYAFSSKFNNHSWYCTKLPWYAYKLRGVNIDFYHNWLITPDSIYHSRHTELIYSKNVPKIVTVYVR